MITEEKVQEMIDKAIEKAIPIITEKTLLSMPEVIGSLMTNQIATVKRNKKFFDDHPEFQKYPDAVKSVIEMLEMKDPLAKYEDILKDAVPKIRKRIETVGKVDMETISANPDREYKQLNAPSDKSFDPNGII